MRRRRDAMEKKARRKMLNKKEKCLVRGRKLDGNRKGKIKRILKNRLYSFYHVQKLRSEERRRRYREEKREGKC